jgi:hypothetical protein
MICEKNNLKDEHMITKRKKQDEWMITMVFDRKQIEKEVSL